MKRERLDEWVRRYRDAWDTNDEAIIGDLFTPDAVYRTGPFDEPWTGREAIVKNWLGHKDVPGTTAFEWQIVAIERDLGIVEGRSTYLETQTEYANLWLIKLARDGRAREFLEYWMQRR